MSLLLAMVVIAFIFFLAWCAWSFIPWIWAKYVVAGIFVFLGIYKSVLLIGALI